MFCPGTFFVNFYIKGYVTRRKGEGFQLKGFLKGENAEYFGKSKGCPPVNHFSATLINHKECTMNG